MAPVFFVAEWDHSRVKWRHWRERASGIPLVWHISFTMVITTLTILLFFFNFSSLLLFYPCWFPSHNFLSASRQPWNFAPSSYMLLYSLGAASCFLRGTRCWLVNFSIMHIWDDSVLFGNFLSILRHLCWVPLHIDSQLKMHVCLHKEVGFHCFPFVIEGISWYHKLSPIWSGIFQVRKIILIKTMELELWIMKKILFNGCPWMSHTI